MHNRVTAITTHFNMLENFMASQIEDLQPTVIFQQNGAPHHWSLTVREFLGEMFLSHWIGHNGLILWPM
jgi:hypothetical protein